MTTTGFTFCTSTPPGSAMLMLVYTHTHYITSGGFQTFTDHVGDIAAKAILIKTKNSHKRVPYGFSVPTDFFDKATGEMILGPENVGLTCSTLVLAIFHMAGFSLVDFTTWKARPEDVVEQKKLLKYMKKQGEKQDYIDAIERQINGFRYRPEEVMAAVLTPKKINTMPLLEPLGKDVVKKIIRFNRV